MNISKKLENYYLLNIVYYISDADTFMKLIKVSKRMINIIKTFKVNTIMLYKIPKSYYSLFENIETIRYSLHDLIYGTKGYIHDIEYFNKYFKKISNYELTLSFNQIDQRVTWEIGYNHVKRINLIITNDTHKYKKFIKYYINDIENIRTNCYIHIYNNLTKIRKDKLTNILKKYGFENKIIFHDCIIPPEYIYHYFNWRKTAKWSILNYIPEYFNFEIFENTDLSELSEYTSIRTNIHIDSLDFSEFNLENLIIDNINEFDFTITIPSY